MPIYEYYCKHCDRQFELLTTISRADQVLCPICGSSEVKRLISMFSARSSGSNGSSSSLSGCAGCMSGSCKSCGHR
ncbi:MAG: zinc ribbon domain-containing protein [Armatimonadetes bacterium]|nr:zinc ribbon domain-containing protein [Armatimonadota bacterium]